ncbi:MAG: hypothetical protein HOY78_15650 [Saccharothrix sp.]|nr:hypothetical protein [Saccharothrix sp.]
MFGSRRQVEALTARVTALEEQVAALSAELDRTRPLPADTARLEASTGWPTRTTTAPVTASRSTSRRLF